MAIYKLVSSKEVISAFDRNFKPNNSNWINDAIEAIGEALEMLRIMPGLTSVYSDICVIDGRGKLPCDLFYLQGVVQVKDNECLSIVRLNKTSRHNIKIGSQGSNGEYYLNPDYIHCPFDSGTLRVYYYTLPVDEKGFPMIPDNAYLKVALRWYILMLYLGRGNTHPVFDYKTAESNWITNSVKAQNQCRSMDADDRQRFKQMWLNLFPINRRWEYEFNSTQQPYDSVLDNKVVRVPYTIDDLTTIQARTVFPDDYL